MYRFIFNNIKKIIPKISETEIIALKSGGTSIDKDLFEGRIDYKKMVAPINKFTMNETVINKVDNLLKKTGQSSVYPDKNIEHTMKYLGKNGFLSMIIDKKYGGNRLPIETQSSILSKIASFNPSLGVVVMVPNSLGPAELLQHYGTNEQKDYFLPKLSDGTFIPCFGLTGPNNGSDAIDKIDEGIVEKINGEIKIRINLNKRYITLAPISNLIGIAFRLNDPNKLLANKKSGISIALVEKEQEGLLLNSYHNPNNAGFPNGTIKGTILINTDQIIGGSDKIGDGWKMLMECLAVGRGVSLPASANGSSKFITISIMNYINIRKQFNMKIGNMEAVKEKFIDMFINTWIIHTSVKLTNNILDSGSTPSVITAIMKQQTTERARSILTNGMDIYAGSGICIGENNFFTKFYNASPIGITVEGSNTLTRGLIIFGQGLNKSHPYIFPIFQNIQDNDLLNFKKNFKNLIKQICFNYYELCKPSNDRLNKSVLKFSLLSNFVALLGGKIKSKQMISGNMADILSNLYLSYSIVWYNHHFKEHTNKPLSKACLDYLLHTIDYKINLIIDNYPIKLFTPFLVPLKNKTIYPKFDDINVLYSSILNDKNLEKQLKKDIYYKDTVLEKMENLNKLDRDSIEYDNLYQEIIRVGEFQNTEEKKHQ
jgi:acyl-CoA dehydrogenase